MKALVLIFLVASFPANAQSVVDQSLSRTDQTKARAAIEAVSSGLLDPRSAQIRGLYQPNERIICGSLNAKNRYNAYAGFNPFGYDTVSKLFSIPSLLMTQHDEMTATRAGMPVQKGRKEDIQLIRKACFPR